MQARNPKVHLLVFADNVNENEYAQMAGKLIEEARALNIFATIRGLTAEDLFKYEDFKKHIPFINRSIRGFGYWLWKPFLIWKVLTEIDEGDMLVYMDAGTKIEIEGKARFLEYLELQKKDANCNLFFEHNNILGAWCKMDTIAFFEAQELINKDVKELIGTFIFTCNTLFNRVFFKIFYESCCEYTLLNDTPSVLPNHPRFIEHRHDQSIFSILARKLCPGSINTNLSNEFIYDVNKKYPIQIHGQFIKKNIIYLFWMGNDVMSKIRTDSFDNILQKSGTKVVFITFKNLNQYVLNDTLLHEGFLYLSSKHQADYMRCYIMHFYGGGYSDIKNTSGNWSSSFDSLNNSDNFICGYFSPSSQLIDSSAFICKQRTVFTQEWYDLTNKFLDSKLESLKKKPAVGHRDCAESKSGYPIPWNAFSTIFHRTCRKYKDKVMFGLPETILDDEYK